MTARLHAAHSSQGACGGCRDLAIKVVQQLNQRSQNIASRADAVAGRCAYRGIRIAQEHQRDVGWKYYAKLRCCSRRYGESWPLDNALGDQLTDGSRSVGPTNGGKSLQCCDLLRHLAIDAIADELIAKSHKRGHRTA